MFRYETGAAFLGGSAQRQERLPVYAFRASLPRSLLLHNVESAHNLQLSRKATIPLLHLRRGLGPDHLGNDKSPFLRLSLLCR